MKKVCTLGGGTGSFTILRALKQLPDLDITAIVAMSDNGGSTGILRDEYGVLPPGDVRQCLVALSREETLMRELFSFRYESGTFQGHSFGNLFLSALEQITGDFEQAVGEASKVLDTYGNVLPVTTENIQLTLTLPDGSKVTGEDDIQSIKLPQKDSFQMSLSPNPPLSSVARKKLLEADFIFIGPGNLYCSLIPVLLPQGVKEVFQQTHAQVIYVANLMQKQLHTEGYTLSNYVEVIEGAIDRKVDTILTNNSSISHAILSHYQDSEQSTPIVNDCSDDPRLLLADIISDSLESQRPGDFLQRTLIRHDPDKLAQVFSQIIQQKN
jgi:uncharacterized cofD-like protein